MSNTRLALALWIGVLIAGCNRQHPEAGGDSSTHWLKSCGADDDCGGLSCVCGVCSRECRTGDECDALAGGSCVRRDDARCGGKVLVCEHECRQDKDCGDPRMACVLAVCRFRDQLGTVLAPHDAGAPRDAELMSSPEAGAPEPMSLSDAGSALVLDAGGAGSGCTPQRAVSNGDDCAISVGFAWDGGACDEVVCGCTGQDCKAIFPTKSACEAAFLECILPTSVCSGLPWYQCGDHCPGDWNLAGGGRSFGECAGECSFELTLSPLRAPPTGSCAGVLSAQLLVKNTQGQPDRLVSMDLTPAAFEEAMRLSRALAGLALEPVTGCPDCADGGKAWIKRQVAGSTNSEESAYEYHHAPPVLRAVDRFVQELIDEAKVCSGPKLASCTSSSASP